MIKQVPGAIRPSSRTGYATSSGAPAGPAGGSSPGWTRPGGLPPEDAVVLDRPGGGGRQAGATGAGDRVRIVAPRLSRIANFDDVDPVRMEPSVDFSFVPARLAASARCRRGGAPRHEVDPRRSRVPAVRGVGPRHHRARPKRRSGHRALRRIPDARPPGARPGRGSTGWRARRPRARPARRRDGDAGREVGAAGRRHLRAERGAALRVRDPHGGHHRPRRGAALRAPRGRRPGRRGERRRPGSEGSYVHGVFAGDEFRARWLEGVRAGASSGARLRVRRRSGPSTSSLTGSKWPSTSMRSSRGAERRRPRIRVPGYARVSGHSSEHSGSTGLSGARFPGSAAAADGPWSYPAPCTRSGSRILSFRAGGAPGRRGRHGMGDQGWTHRLAAERDGAPRGREPQARDLGASRSTRRSSTRSSATCSSATSRGSASAP